MEYYIVFEKENSNLKVYEQHKGNCKGCIWTFLEYTGRCISSEKEIDNFLEEYEKLCDGHIVGFEIADDISFAGFA